MIGHLPGRPFRVEFENRLFLRASALGFETKTIKPCKGDRLLIGRLPGRPFGAEFENRLFLRASALG